MLMTLLGIVTSLLLVIKGIYWFLSPKIKTNPTSPLFYNTSSSSSFTYKPNPTCRKRAVITGGNGNVGRGLTRSLLSHGYEVISIDIVPPKKENQIKSDKLFFHLVDISSPSSISTMTEIMTSAEVVFHTAAIVRFDMYAWPWLQNVNVNGTIHVLNAAAHAGVPYFIFTSSVSTMHHAVGGFDKFALLEADETSPLPEPKGCTTNYGGSKIIGERIILETSKKTSMKTTALRFPLILSVDDTHLMQRVLSGNIPISPSGAVSTWCDIEDAIEGHITAFFSLKQKDSHANGQAFIITGRERVRSIEILKQVGERLHFKPIRVMPNWVFYILCCAGEVTQWLTCGYYWRLSFTTLWRSAFKQTMQPAIFTTKKAESVLGWKQKYTLRETVDRICTEWKERERERVA